MRCECGEDFLCMPCMMVWELSSVEDWLRNRDEHDLANQLSTITVQLTDKLGANQDANKRSIISEHSGRV